MATLYAEFSDAAQAEKAAGALLDHGVRQEDISLVAHDEYGRTRTTAGTDGVGRGTTNVAASGLDATKSVGDRLAQAGDRMAGAVTGAVGATGTAAGFEAGADQRAANAETRTAMAGNENVVHGSTVGVYNTPTGVTAEPIYTGTTDRTALDPLDNETMVTTAAPGNATEQAAKHGLSTTTPEDAAAGAVRGTEIGLGAGLLIGLASLIPGVGWIVGAGALATALGAAALGAGVGAAVGGVTGYLKDQGVPAEAVTRYQTSISGGGALLQVNVPSNGVDEGTVHNVLQKYGGQVNMY